MKKKLIATALALALTAGAALSGCTAQAEQPKEEPGGEKGAPSVVFVTGQASDKSLLESAANGLRMIEEAYGCKTKVIEFGTDTTKMEPTLEDVSDTEWDIVLVGTFSSVEPLEKVAANHPDQKYIIFDTQMDYTDGKNANIYSMAARAPARKAPSLPL